MSPKDMWERVMENQSFPKRGLHVLERGRKGVTGSNKHKTVFRALEQQGATHTHGQVGSKLDSYEVTTVKSTM